MHNRFTFKLALPALFSIVLLVSTVSSIPAVHAVRGSAGSVEFLNYTGMITSVGAVTPSGTNDFTYEMWIKPSALDNLHEEILFTTGTNRNREASSTIGNCNSLTLGLFGNKPGYTFGHWKSNTTAAITGTLSGGVYMSATLLTAQWYHIALTQTSNVITLWVDGIRVASSSNIPGDITGGGSCATRTGKADYATTPIIFSDTALYFGEGYYGRISNYRYTLSSARYTSTFTPPTVALTSGNANEWLVPFDYTTNNTYELINNIVTTTPFTLTPTGSGPSGNGNIVAGSVISREFNPFTKFTPTFTWSNVSKNFGDASFTLTAPSPSTPGTFTYSSGTTSVISLTGTTATVGNAGTSVITATFTPTNTVDYNSTTTTMTITVIGNSQTITFQDLLPITLGGAVATLTATSSSNLTVAFTSATTSVCTVTGTTITVLTTGTCTINANQAGNGTYAAATQVQKSFLISPVPVVDDGAALAAAAAASAKRAAEQKELTEILALIPEIAKMSLALGETTKSLYEQKCVKGKSIKYVKSGAKCPKGYVIYKKSKAIGS